MMKLRINFYLQLKLNVLRMEYFGNLFSAKI
jgi:hypothetical protein